jgi:hypothetical protein
LGLILGERSKSNAVIKAVRAKLNAMSFTEDDLEQNKQIIKTIRDTSEDPRVRFNAAKLMVDMTLKSQEINIDIMKYEEPPITKQQLEHSGIIQVQRMELPAKVAIGEPIGDI